MEGFLKEMTFWKTIGIVLILCAAGWALSRIILAVRGTSPESEYLKQVAESMKSGNQSPPVAV